MSFKEENEKIMCIFGVLLLVALVVFLYFKFKFLIQNPSCLIVECRQIVEVPK